MNIIVEGAKRAGKSHLLGTLDINTFKIPFVEYFHGVIGKEGERGENNRDIHWLNAGCDLAVCALSKQGLIQNIVIDRGPVSNVVFAVMQKRITEKEGLKHIDWLSSSGYMDSMVTVLIKAGENRPERNKDAWEVLDPVREAEMLEKYLDRISHKSSHLIYKFTNNYDEESVINFNELIRQII